MKLLTMTYCMEKLTIMARQDGDADLKEKDRSRRPELFDEVKFEGILHKDSYQTQNYCEWLK